jgi:hypothetical protein
MLRTVVDIRLFMDGACPAQHPVAGFALPHREVAELEVSKDSLADRTGAGTLRRPLHQSMHPIPKVYVFTGHSYPAFSSVSTPTATTMASHRALANGSP